MIPAKDIIDAIKPFQGPAMSSAALEKPFESQEVIRELDDLVKKGYLKNTKKGYIDSNKTTQLLKKGYSREQINKMLEAKK